MIDKYNLEASRRIRSSSEEPTDDLSGGEVDDII